MTKPRTCPHCSAQIDICYGYSYDEKLNLICENCDKVVIPVDDASVVPQVGGYADSRTSTYQPYQAPYPALRPSDA